MSWKTIFTISDYKMQVYIHAQTDSPRTASLLESRDFSTVLVRWTAALAEKHLGPCSITNLVGKNGDLSEKTGALATRIHAAIKADTDWATLAAELGAANQPVIVLCPFDGVLSRSRLESFSRRFARLEAPCVARCARKVPANINPYWLKALPAPKEQTGKAFLGWKDFQASSLAASVKSSTGSCTIAGSQHLPTLYMQDDAVIGIKGVPERGQTHQHTQLHHDTEDDQTLNMFYRFNLFNFSPRQPLHLQSGFLDRMRQALSADMEELFSGNLAV